MMRLIDTHTHLFSDQFDSDRHDAVQRAIDAGVERMYLPNISRDTTAAMNALADAFPQHCFPMMGLHPCHVDDNLEAELAHVEQELASGRYTAVGETGLDYHWDTHFAEQQKLALQQQIGWAKRYHLPIVLHTRESFDDTYRLIAEQNDDTLTGVFHCFSGSINEAEKVAALGGFYIGIGGVATFAKSSHPDVLPKVPAELIVLETDAPYLAPKPHRGKRNESAYLPRIAERVAQLKGMAPEDLAQITTDNARRLYQAE